MEQRALEAARLYSDLDCSIPFSEQVRRFETRLINQALELTDGHQKRAASLLGLQPTTLHEKMKRLGLLSGRTPKPE
jgi:DNA-binding NtrC family response regulator